MSSSRPSPKSELHPSLTATLCGVGWGGSFSTPPSGRSGHFIVFGLINLASYWSRMGLIPPQCVRERRFQKQQQSAGFFFFTHDAPPAGSWTPSQASAPSDVRPSEPLSKPPVFPGWLCFAARMTSWECVTRWCCVPFGAHTLICQHVLMCQVWKQAAWEDTYDNNRWPRGETDSPSS